MLLHEILKIGNVGKRYNDEETDLTFEVQYHGTLEFICVDGATCLYKKKIQDIYELSNIVHNNFDFVWED